jgi:alcohol dehydrogenase
VRAVVYTAFRAQPSVQVVPDPAPPAGGVVVRVERTGLCRSDWHAWQGHDPDVQLPHVGGHELAGTIVAKARDVTRFNEGDRVTVPFVSGCGSCRPCTAGDPQVCDRQFQPGFTHWGSFAEYVTLRHADRNVVLLPPELSFAAAASLGCRFVTAYRGIVELARLKAGEWLAVHGCGGVGLSAVMIAQAVGARSIAVDIDPAKLELARALGAEAVVDARASDAAEAVRAISSGGVEVSLDALGSAATVRASVYSLGKRGRHVQVGLLIGEGDPKVPMDRVVAYELSLLGSHGIAATHYPDVFALIAKGALSLDRLLGRTLSLAELPQALADLGSFKGVGVTLVAPS